MVMRRSFLIVSLLALSIIPGFAQSKGATAPNPDNMTLGDCLGILTGLQSIDNGRSVIIKIGTPQEQVVQQPFEFGSATLRLGIARNITTLSAIQKDAQVVQQKIFAEVAKGDSEIKPSDSARVAQYDKQLKELMARPCSVNLVKIKDSDLKLDRNEIPANALALIDRIRDK